MTTPTVPRTRNRRMAVVLLGVTALSFGFGFALVPLYDVFCELTGLNGKTAAVAGIAAKPTEGDAHRIVAVEFTSTVMPGLPWAIMPQTARLEVHPGELHHVSYRVRNLSDQPVVAQAIPSVSPGLAAASFEKLECFCFSQQALKPGESQELPLAFTVKPGIDKDVHTITLAYAFFKLDDAKTSSATERP